MASDGMPSLDVQASLDGKVSGGFIVAPVPLSWPPERLPGVHYSIDCSAAFRGAADAAISSADLGKNDGPAAALRRESPSLRSLNPWPIAC